jgi:hypothetical protein
MNAVGLLIVLLVLSYVGSVLVGARAKRGAGLPAGSEYVLLGFILGPNASGILNRAALGTFDPLAEAAISWLALIVALEFGRAGDRLVRPARIILSSLTSLMTASAIAGAALLVLRHFSSFSRDEMILIAGGIGAASCGTTGHAVRWVVDRYDARGPLADLFADVANNGDIIPIVAVSALFALMPAKYGQWSPALSMGVTAGAGALLGMVTVILTRGHEFETGGAWGFVLGASMLGIGIADRLELAPLMLAFFMGITLTIFSRHRRELRAMISPTERPIMLPALLLAGARISFPSGSLWIALAAVTLLVRFISNILLGLVLRARAPAARNASALLGAGFLSSGPIGVSIALAFALRFPGAIGEAVLVTNVVITIAGELIGPANMRAALERAGEIQIAARDEELA